MKHGSFPHRRAPLALLGALLLLIPRASAETPGSGLAYQLQAGQEFSYQLVTETTSIMASMEVENKNTQTLDFSLRVEEAQKDAPALVRLTLTRIRAKGAFADYDSMSEENHSFEALPLVLGALVNQPFQIHMSETGEISGLEELDGKIAKAIDRVSQEQPHMGAAIAELRRGFNGSTFLVDLRKAMPRLPGNGESKDSSWSDTLAQVLPNFGTMEEKVTYKLKSLAASDGEELATILGESSATLAQNPFIKMIESKGIALIHFSTTNGRVRKSEHRADLVLSMKFPGTDEEKTSMIIRTVLQEVP